MINEVRGGRWRTDVDGGAISWWRWWWWWCHTNPEDKNSFWSQESDVSELSSHQSEDRLVLRWRWIYSRYEQVVSVVMDEVDVRQHHQHLSSEPLVGILMILSRPAGFYSRAHLLRHQTTISWMALASSEWSWGPAVLTSTTDCISDISTSSGVKNTINVSHSHEPAV